MLKTMTSKHVGLHGSYDSATHTMELFLTAPTDKYNGWENEAEQVKRDATMKPSTIGVMVQDPSAPRLKGKPVAAAVYKPEIDCFLPCVNVTCTRREWDDAYSHASALAGYCTASLQRTGKLPSQMEIVKDSRFSDARLFYPDGGNSVVQEMLRRMNRR